MQNRQTNRYLYFKELARTSKKYFLPYIQRFKAINPDLLILEIGCGDGGNLLPFAKIGCKTTGIDLAETRIKDAKSFFEKEMTNGTFIHGNIFEINDINFEYDVIICHDVFEHIDKKSLFIKKLHKYIKPKGIVFMSFPAWQMPFGGHQQICRNKIVSHLPFIHLLPNILYSFILKFCGESQSCIRELLNIKETKLTIEQFEKLIQDESTKIIDKQFYFINPHYETKFGLRPRKLARLIGKVPYIRNFFITSCFYILSFKESEKE